VTNVSFELNLSALMAVLLGVTLTRFAAMGHYTLRRKVYPGFKAFVLAEFFGLVSMVSVILRARFGENVLLVCFTGIGFLLQPALVYHGLGVFGRLPKLKARTRQNLALAAAACLACLADLLLAPDIVRRGLFLLGAALVLCLRIGLELPLFCRRKLTGMYVLCSTYLLVAGIHAARVWELKDARGYDYVAMMQADGLLGFLIFFKILQSVLELYVVYTMNSQMLEDDLRTATAQIERVAQTDALTGALNRRGLDLLGGEALRKSYSEKQPVSVIMLDLDWFKQVNDSLGHAAGDELLGDVASLCQGALRAEDVFARFGGEEFVIVAPSTAAEEAVRLAERVRQTVEGARFAATNGETVTASFGVVSADAASLDELLQRADEALYAAKQAGRNRVVMAGRQVGSLEAPA
jgi:diguanylate cyclase (GGDEF)-like protein